MDWLNIFGLIMIAVITVGILHHDEGVDLIPANLELSAMEFNLVNAMSRETALRNYLSEVKEKYDYRLTYTHPKDH